MSKPRPYRCHMYGCRKPTMRATLDCVLCIEHAHTAWSYYQRNTQPALMREAVAELKSEMKAEARQAKTARAAAGEGTIYYLRLHDTIKIGWTADLERRLKDYPPYAEVLAEHPGTRAEETDLHKTFTPSRTHGREWYQPTPELVAHIERVRAERSGGKNARFPPSNGLPGPRPRPSVRHRA